MSNYKVYKHTLPNGKIYIGITQQNVDKRWSNGYGYNRQELFYRAIKKYGWNNIKHEILFSDLTKEDAEKKEIELISFYKCNDVRFGYNIQNGGNSIGKHSLESRIKMSVNQKGKHQGENHWWFGKKHTQETLKKMSEKQRGKNNAMYGKHLSQETREKLSKARKNRVFSEKEKKQRSDRQKIKVSQFSITNEFIRDWDSLKEASLSLGIASGDISRCCKGQRKSSKGYIWKYKTCGRKFIKRDKEIPF